MNRTDTVNKGEKMIDKTLDLFASRGMAAQKAVDEAAACAARDEGIRIAEAHAASQSPDWPELAWFFLKAAVEWRNLSRFQTTDFRKWAEARGLPRPPDPRAYGGVMRRAARAGMIVADGYAPKTDSQAHCCPATIWRAL